MPETQRPVLLRLREAVLALAAQAPVQDLSVSEVCREAGVTRDTFYRYATSPTNLLAEFFEEELETLLDVGPFVDADGEAVIQRCTVPARKWLEHVMQYEQVYRHAAQPRLPYALVAALGRCVHTLLIELLNQRPAIAPRVLGEQATQDDIDLFATFIVAGTIALFERELFSFPVIDIERTIDVVRGAATGWVFS